MISRVLACTLFAGSGILHLVKAEVFRTVVPPALPAPGVLVAVSGAAEIAGAIGIALVPTRNAAAIGLIALLVAVFPANVYMATDHAKFASLGPAWAWYARLPLQAVLIAWVWSLRA